MRIYISGKITGLPIEEAQANFASAAQLIRDHGHEAVNPMELVPFNKEWEWEDYMKADIKILMDCDGLFLLKNWGESAGATIEYELALKLKIPVFQYSKISGILPLFTDYVEWDGLVGKTVHLLQYFDHISMKTHRGVIVRNISHVTPSSKEKFLSQIHKK